MTSCAVCLLLAVVGGVLVARPAGAESSCHTPMSAFSVRDIVYLVTDRNVFQFAFNGEQINADADIPVHISGQTAAVSISYSVYSLLSCDQNRAYDASGREKPGANTLPAERYDAAFRRYTDAYLISGDSYKIFDTRTEEISEEQPNARIGLPDKVDAAWATQDSIFALKGRDLYVADYYLAKPRDPFYFLGPLPFDLFFQFSDRDVSLCPP